MDALVIGNVQNKRGAFHKFSIPSWIIMATLELAEIQLGFGQRWVWCGSIYNFLGLAHC
ncbi:hypothetical protein ACJIZ3_001926 [Penstemon smallii]|uniref:Uncharacterized protein n=1 Tax=Penstemon smallii TaxID=265156 RepID=A0ABD3U7I4_9LAMI